MAKSKASVLDNLVAILNNNLGRPEATWTKSANGRFTANLRNLSLSAQSPGDGCTRYTLEEITSEGGGVTTYWTALGKREAESMLRAMLDTLRLVRDSQNA